jgi:adenosylcobinamide-GDP ribazoletransferase
MKKQLDIFFTALMFLTRLPVPRNIAHGADMLQRSARYFPWVGWVVGALTALVYWIAGLVFSPVVTLLLTMISSIFITGAFHEDGFADVCDAFGGGWTKEKILLIMKDSRLGTFGVTGLIGTLSLKFALLLELSAVFHSPLAFAALAIAAHSSSRLAALTVMQQYGYVTDPDQSKSKPMANRKLYTAELVVAITGGLLPFVFLPPVYLLALLPMVLVRLYLGWYFNKWIGGYTGDCLGATQQVCEIALYMGCLLVWKFI